VYPRFIEHRIREALADTRVVMISGPRQSGKTTLAEKLATAGVPFLTLDDQTTLETARADPVGFIRGLDRAVIDEVQRAPEVLLAIKRSVDTDKRPGRFLLTGSANLMTLPNVADSLAGRMEIAELLPLSQSELRRKPSDFLELVLQGKPPTLGEPIVGAELVQRVLAGGMTTKSISSSKMHGVTWWAFRSNQPPLLLERTSPVCESWPKPAASASF
jgi:predicted AAA+ superfamily ATPase